MPRISRKSLLSSPKSSSNSSSPNTMMLLLSHPSASLPCALNPRLLTLGAHTRTQKCSFSRKVVAMAKGGSEEAGSGALEKTAIAAGLVSTPVIAWSLFTLKTTGCGLPPGPGGSIGALEGVSYLIVVGIVGWSLYTKTKTGSGLPNGPFGLLGAVEGLSYLSLLAILLVFGFQFVDKGSLPGPLPGDECFG